MRWRSRRDPRPAVAFKAALGGFHSSGRPYGLQSETFLRRAEIIASIPAWEVELHLLYRSTNALLSPVVAKEEWSLHSRGTVIGGGSLEGKLDTLFGRYREVDPLTEIMLRLDIEQRFAPFVSSLEHFYELSSTPEWLEWRDRIGLKILTKEFATHCKEQSGPLPL